MKKCKCGSNSFNTIYSTRVILELKNGVLTAIEEEDLGDSGVYACSKCDKEYQRKDFEEIIYS